MNSPDPTASPELPPLPAGPFLFVSYASVDRARVLTIAHELREAGSGVWIDQVGITGGAAYGTEIATALKESAAVALMCSAASLASRNVRQEIMLAWRYNRPILPLLLEPTTFPDDVAYWLEGAQWIEVLDHPAADWLPQVARALSRHGVPLTELADTAPAPAVPVVPLSLEQVGNLPPAAGQLIGREREVREVLALIAQGRWVTLTGPGGTGKTRLALEAARRGAADLPGGAWFVDLAAVSDPGQILPAIAAALEVAETPGRAWLDLLEERIGDQRLLLVLDNLEQIAAGAQQVSQLAERCENLIVLATSRTPLQTSGEWVYVVSPFSLPDLHSLPPLPLLMQNPAVQLFVERARAVRPDFVMTDGVARPVAEICHRLDGLPLAIELAAARIRLLTPATILTRLGSRLNLLTRGAGVRARQQTLRDTIAWSFGLLSPTEQATFCRLAVFAGGATVEGGEAVIRAIDATAEPLDDIAALVDHSLLRVEHPGGDAPPRVRMLETIREYATERLTERDEIDASRAAHATYFLRVAVASESDLWSQRPGPVLAALRSDDDNLRAALDWLAVHPDPEQEDAELRLAASLVGYWRRIGRYAEAADRLSGALRRVAGGSPRARAKALMGAGFIAARQGDFAGARGNYAAALALRQRSGDRAGEADVLQYLAEIAEYAAASDEVRVLRERVLAIRLELGDEQGAATATHDLGVAALYQGDYEGAIASITSAIHVFRRAADARNLALALNDLTAAEMLSGRGDAVRHAAEGLALWRTLDDRYAAFQATLTYGRALQLTGRLDESASILDQGLTEGREFGDAAGISLALYGLGLCALAREEPEIAFAHLEESLRISHESGEKWHVAERLEALAAVWVAQGEAERAARLLGAAAELRTDGGFPVPPAEQEALNRTIGAITGAIGPERVATAIAAGRAADLETTVAEALGG